MEINVFKLCTGLKALGYSIIFFVAAIICLSYYAVVLLTWGPRLLRGSPLAFLIVIVFHLLLVMLGWSYVRVVFRDPGQVPAHWKPADLPEEEASASEPGRTSAEHRYCNYCCNWKPPRCHHCSVCRRCVLKMDHHCVWVANCVGARNYKFFLLFLVYTFLETTLDTLALLPSFIKFFDKAKDHSSSPGTLAVIFLDFVLNLAFSLSLLCFIIMHASLLLSNTTSVEVHEKKGVVRWKYDLGKKKNLEQVLGTKKALWFLPLFSKEDLDNIPALHGLDFPTRSEVEV